MMKVLVLDDEPTIASTVKTALEAAGFTVRTSLTSEEARRFIEEDPPQVVVLDIKLKEANGLTVLKWIKSHFPAIEVIVLTGYDDQEVEAQAHELGVLGVIRKPVSVPELQEQVRAFTARLGKAP